MKGLGNIRGRGETRCCALVLLFHRRHRPETQWTPIRLYVCGMCRWQIAALQREGGQRIERPLQTTALKSCTTVRSWIGCFFGRKKCFWTCFFALFGKITRGAGGKSVKTMSCPPDILLHNIVRFLLQILLPRLSKFFSYLHACNYFPETFVSPTMYKKTGSCRRELFAKREGPPPPLLPSYIRAAKNLPVLLLLNWGRKRKWLSDRYSKKKRRRKWKGPQTVAFAVYFVTFSQSEFAIWAHFFSSRSLPPQKKPIRIEGEILRRPREQSSAEILKSAHLLLFSSIVTQCK